MKRAISLFWGSAEDTLDIVEKHSSEKIKAYEKRKHRLVADSILKYDEHLYHTLISWFIENSYEIADFCSSKGLAKNPKDWTNWICNKTLIGEHEVDKLFSIESICAPIEKSQNMKPITAIVEAELQYSYHLVLFNSIKVKCSFTIILIKSII